MAGQPAVPTLRATRCRVLWMSPQEEILCGRPKYLMLKENCNEIDNKERPAVPSAATLSGRADPSNGPCEAPLSAKIRIWKNSLLGSCFERPDQRCRKA